MAYFEWTEEMSVGVELLDADHRALINWINQLESISEEATRDIHWDDWFRKLNNYIRFHFSREEKVMETCGFQELVDHRQEHLRFEQEVAALREHCHPGMEVSLVARLLELLRYWLKDHILVSDRKYVRYVALDPKLARQVASVFGPSLDDPYWSTLRADDQC